MAPFAFCTVSFHWSMKTCRGGETRSIENAQFFVDLDDLDKNDTVFIAKDLV